jgi:hypothetical protein
MSDTGGWLWLLVDVILVGLLAAGLIYGTIAWRSRRRSAQTEQATRDLYRRGAEREQRGSTS